ncbi:AraC family transcriptional regulator [Clostridium chromiireducens]|uniref:AraC family transcriptional regulator n=2 Tax=Clostridium chromiireducens TaxID=225345 RepID=A0A1V4I478_9CLOT|nr:AraC family transcriptional regulator [Clostridium chromiireducens]OPJ54776.1 multiple antibiotic resistance protein MarA [Clostridium chromiireducens]RII33167.1 AraC family transcriptional regulator [Clostridium chromiireducens]
MYPFFEANKSGDQNFFSSKILDNFTFPPHLHPYVEIVYVIEGSIEVTINDFSRSLSVGEASVCFPNDIHSFNNEEFSKILLFIFSPDLTGSFFGTRMDKTLENPFMYKATIDEGVSSLLYMLHDEFIKYNNKYVVKGLLYTILGKLEPHFTLKNSSHFYNITIQNLLKYIEVHYQEKISLESIAKDLGFSKFYLSRIFSNKIGFQFNDYVNRLRINKAQKLLSETDLPITVIALECGFESQRNFNRIFKELTSLTPTKFRITLSNP